MTEAEVLDLEEVELGERAADWLLREELGSAYSDLKDRAWSVTLGCYAKCVQSLGADSVPAEWRPRLDEHGMWIFADGAGLAEAEAQS